MDEWFCYSRKLWDKQHRSIHLMLWIIAIVVASARILQLGYFDEVNRTLRLNYLPSTVYDSVITLLLSLSVFLFQAVSVSRNMYCIPNIDLLGMQNSRAFYFNSLKILVMQTFIMALPFAFISSIPNIFIEYLSHSQLEISELITNIFIVMIAMILYYSIVLSIHSIIVPLQTLGMNLLWNVAIATAILFAVYAFLRMFDYFSEILSLYKFWSVYVGSRLAYTIIPLIHTISIAVIVYVFGRRVPQEFIHKLESAHIQNALRGKKS